MHILIFPFSPGWIDPRDCNSETEEEAAGKRLPALTPVPDADEFEETRQLVKPIRCSLGSPIQVRETQSTFHPHGQRNAFRRRDVKVTTLLLYSALQD
jgi:hypothetical protein